MSENRCVCCGEIAPEGVQVCGRCGFDNKILDEIYWIPENRRPKSFKYICSGCGNVAYDPNSQKSSRFAGKKYCSLRYCPNCGKKARRTAMLVLGGFGRRKK